MATTARINITAEDRTKAAFASVQGGLRKLGNAAKIATAAVTGATAGLAAMTAQGMKSADQLGKTADKIGTTTKALGGLRLAASQTAGVSQQQLDTALQRLSRRAAEASTGTGTLAKELERLGIDAQAFNNLSVDEQFRTLGTAMEGVTNQGDRLRIAMAAFDTEGAALEATLGASNAQLDQFESTAEALGLSLNRDTVAGIEAANDSLELLTSSGKGFSQLLAANLAPAIESVSNRLVQMALDNDFVRQAADSMAMGLTNAVGGMVRAVGGAMQAFNVIQAGVARVFEVSWNAASKFFGLLSEAAEFLGLHDIANGLQGVSDGLETMSLSAAENYQLNMEQALGWLDVTTEVHEAIRAEHEKTAATVQKTTKTQVGAMKTVNKALMKDLKNNMKWLDNEAKRKQKADQDKINSTQSYANAAVSIGNALFGENKALAMASIVADTAAGIARTWAQLGWPAALPGVAAIAASGAAQLAAARGATKGGGGSISTGSGGAGGAAVSAAQSPSPVLQDSLGPAGTSGPTNTVSISLSGGLYSREEVRELINRINDEVGDGATLQAT